MNEQDTQTDIAVVVGATGAFGRVIAARLAAEGLRVLAVARSEAQLAELAAQVPGLLPCPADIGADAAIAAIAAALDGPVRMLVHGPGVDVAGGVMSVPTEAVATAVNIKVNGLLRLVRAADERLVAGSRIVAIGGHYGFEPSAYAACAGIGNAALTNLVRQLSLALGPRGITAHQVAPGPADTERLHRVAADKARLQGCTVEEVLADMLRDSSIGRFTTPAQVAWAVAMLLDPEADAMTGSALMLDSGRRRGLP